MIACNRILFLDNKESIRQSFRERLVSRGYEVYTAATPEEADAILACTRIQIAIIDVRLSNEDKDEADRGGMEYVRTLQPPVVPLLLSAWRTDELMHEAVFDNPDGTLPIEEFLNKNDEIKTTLDRIDRVFTKKVLSQINHAPDLFEWRRRFELKQLIQPFLHDSNCDEGRLMEEVEELLRRLCLTETKVKLYPMEFGRGGGAIVFARPVYPQTNGQTNGEPFVIKLGWVEDIQLEIDKYKKYVLPYASHNSTTFRTDEVRRTAWLMGFKMSFVGATSEKPRDLNSVFIDHHVPDSALKELIGRVFKSTSARWYENKKPWGQGVLGVEVNENDSYRPMAADLAIGFDAASELAVSVRALLDGQSYHHVRFTAQGAERIRVTIDGTEQELPNPLAMLRARPGRLPPPSFWAITHGDLNGKNVLVDGNLTPWLIDFTRTGWGAVLRDVAELESAVVFELIHKIPPSVSLTDLLTFQKAILSPAQFADGIELPVALQVKPFTRALTAVQTLRDVATDIIETKRIGEYYVLLFYYALKMVTWKGITSFDEDMSDVRRRHALYAALLLCAKLDTGPAPAREVIV